MHVLEYREYFLQLLSFVDKRGIVYRLDGPYKQTHGWQNEPEPEPGQTTCH